MGGPFFQGLEKAGGNISKGGIGCNAAFQCLETGSDDKETSMKTALVVAVMIGAAVVVAVVVVYFDMYYYFFVERSRFYLQF